PRVRRHPAAGARPGAAGDPAHRRALRDRRAVIRGRARSRAAGRAPGHAAPRRDPARASAAALVPGRHRAPRPDRPRWGCAPGRSPGLRRAAGTSRGRCGSSVRRSRISRSGKDKTGRSTPTLCYVPPTLADLRSRLQAGPPLGDAVLALALTAASLALITLPGLEPLARGLGIAPAVTRPPDATGLVLAALCTLPVAFRRS